MLDNQWGFLLWLEEKPNVPKGSVHARNQKILRSRYDIGLLQNEIACSCSIGQASVHRYLERASAAGLSWPLPEDWDDRRLSKMRAQWILVLVIFPLPCRRWNDPRL